MESGMDPNVKPQALVETLGYIAKPNFIKENMLPL